MTDVLHVLAASPWVLVVVFAVSGLDAVLPLMPSETTVVAVAVGAAASGRPHPVVLVIVAAAGAYLGDWVSFRIGRRAAPPERLGRRARLVHDWARLMVDRRGGLLIVFARYVPGGRSATAFAAGAVGYPARRFGLYTGAAVILWAAQGASLGYFGGVAFEDDPLAALLVAGAAGLVVMTVAAVLQRCSHRRVTKSSPSACRYAVYRTVHRGTTRWTIPNVWRCRMTEDRDIDGLIDPEAALQRETETIAQRFPDVDRADIDQRVHDTYAELKETARVQSHLIAVTEGQVTDELRHEGAEVHVRGSEAG
jgi:membrane-associated protein